MHTVFALLCFVVVIHWLIFPYPSGLLHWHCGNLTIAPVPAKQPWWIWINTSCEFIMNDCITTTKQSTTKPCAYFLGYTVYTWCSWPYSSGSFRLIMRLPQCQRISLNYMDKSTGNKPQNTTNCSMYANCQWCIWVSNVLTYSHQHSKKRWTVCSPSCGPRVIAYDPRRMFQNILPLVG